MWINKLVTKILILLPTTLISQTNSIDFHDEMKDIIFSIMDQHKGYLAVECKEWNLWDSDLIHDSIFFWDSTGLLKVNPINNPLDAYSELRYKFGEANMIYFRQQFQNNTIRKLKINLYPDSILTYKRLRIINLSNRSFRPRLYIFRTFKRPFYEYSIPLFTIDGEYAIINEIYYAGPVIAYEDIIILFKKNGTWVEVKRIGEWLS
jgi:hypothetical protein